jgi:hypothetical protein
MNELNLVKATSLNDLAKELDCKGLRLCTGIENEQGKKFYERNGWSLRAVAYKKKLVK